MPPTTATAVTLGQYYRCTTEPTYNHERIEAADLVIPIRRLNGVVDLATTHFGLVPVLEQDFLDGTFVASRDCVADHELTELQCRLWHEQRTPGRRLKKTVKTLRRTGRPFCAKQENKVPHQCNVTVVSFGETTSRLQWGPVDLAYLPSRYLTMDYFTSEQ
jgi:hypothetical protein